jgi:hypothetical protein
MAKTNPADRDHAGLAVAREAWSRGAASPPAGTIGQGSRGEWSILLSFAPGRRALSNGAWAHDDGREYALRAALAEESSLLREKEIMLLKQKALSALSEHRPHRGLQFVAALFSPKNPTTDTLHVTMWWSVAPSRCHGRTCASAALQPRGLRVTYGKRTPE